MKVPKKLTRKLFGRPSFRCLRRHGNAPNSAESPVTEKPANNAMRRRTEITIETQRVLRITKGTVTETLWCDECAFTVSMVSPEAAAVLFGVPTRVIYRLVEAGCLHLIERPGLLLVCQSSLEASIANDVKTRKLLQ